MSYVELPLIGKRGAGKAIRVDVADAPRLACHRFRLDGHGYVITTIKGRTVLLHRLILDAPVGTEVDHRNGDRLDNRRENLRLASRAQNASNRGLSVANRSGFKGVRWHRGTGRWEARIKVDGRDRYLGLHNDPRVAARVYDTAALEAFGPFAVTNASLGLV